MEIALVDFGTGNLHTLARALEANGTRVRIEAEVADALSAAALVLPGVTPYTAAAAQLSGHAGVVRAALAGGLPCLAIGTGMAVLFETSEEGIGQGVGFLRGRVARLRCSRLPHTGWNLVATADDPLFVGCARPFVYFSNSHAAEPTEPGRVIGWTEYGGQRFPAAVRSGNTVGVQFRPEKSGGVGLRVLANFISFVRAV